MGQDRIRSNIDAVKELAASGYADCDIVKALGVSSSTVCYWHRALNESEKVDRKVVCDRYLASRNTSGVANEFGISVQALRYILESSGIIVSKHSWDEDFFSRDTPETFYWAGFMAADGCAFVSKRGYKTIHLGMSDKDLGHLLKYKKAIRFSGKEHRSVKTDEYGFRTMVTISIRSDKLFDDIARFSIVPRKTFTLFMPEWLKIHKLVGHFIRGYIDGDGSFMIDKGRTLRLSICGTKQFLEATRSIIIDQSDIKTSGHLRQTRNIYQLDFGGNGVVPAIRDYLYNGCGDDIVLRRKCDVAYTIIERGRVNCKPVIRVDKLTGEEVRFDAAIDAEEQGWHRENISLCCRREFKKHSYKGYWWKFAPTKEKV